MGHIGWNNSNTLSMDVFKLSRNWFDFCFENPELISPNHSAMYFFCIEHCNRLGWKEKFGLPMEMTKDAIGIKNYRTFAKTFKDLVDWGFIKVIQKSQNQYSSNIIAIAENTKSIAKSNTKALDKAMIKHSQKQDQERCKSIVGIDIQETILQETRNNKTIFEDFRKIYPGTKRGLNTEFENFKKKHTDWQSVLIILSEKLLDQINERQLKESRKQFVPEWKNLQTWINQRCWEEETKIEKTIIKPTSKVDSYSLFNG